jgi:hypothetical protein
VADFDATGNHANGLIRRANPFALRLLQGHDGGISASPARMTSSGFQADQQAPHAPSLSDISPPVCFLVRSALACRQAPSVQATQSGILPR